MAPRRVKTPTPASTATQSEATSYTTTSATSTSATATSRTTQSVSESSSATSRVIKKNKTFFIVTIIGVVIIFIIVWAAVGVFIYNVLDEEEYEDDDSNSDTITKKFHTTKGPTKSSDKFHPPKSRIASEIDQLRVPEGFAIELYARVERAGFLLALPGDFVLVSQPTKGTIKLLKPRANSTAEVSDFATGLGQPHDMVLYNAGENNSYLYVAESNQIVRYPFNKGDRKIGKAQVVVADLPDNAGYGYNHDLKKIAIRNDTLYVSIGSTSNADPKDLNRDPKAGAIYGYNLTGENRRLIAEGIRNAEGMALAPGSEDLWIVNNQRDNVKYPYRDDSGNYSHIIADYANKNPPEEFTKIEEGKNYGWPYCNPVSSDSMDDLDYVPDVDNNENETVVNCSTFRRVDKGIEAHSTPLGLTFWTGENVDEKYRGGALVAMHGSLESSISGNKVSFFPWVNGRPGAEVDFVTGWVNGKERWGRPVDTAVLEDGSVLISDDTYDAVYKLYKK